MKKIIPLLLVSSVTVLSGCGGGGGSDDTSGGPVDGLDIPVTLSVVTPKETSSTAKSSVVVGLNADYRAVFAALNDPTTNYSKDPVNTHVFDQSVESLQTVNMILCLMDQTRAADRVNKGAYIALVNNDKCETGKNKSSAGQSGQSSGQTVKFEKWTINSTRTDNSSPMIVKIWVPKENGGGGGGGGPPNPMDQQEILVETTVTEAISSTNPFGKFTLNFKGVVDGGGMAGTPIELMKGALFTVSNSSGKPEFKFIELAGDALGGMGMSSGMSSGMSRKQASHVLLDDANGNMGQAVTHTAETFNFMGKTESRSDTFAVAFNTENFLRQTDSLDPTKDETVCTSRTQFNTNVWRYNLYHAVDGTFKGRDVTAGQRVELSSGFPFTYNGQYGHVGYWGVWYEGGNLADGTTIQQVNFATGASTDYTVHVAPGKLIHRQGKGELLNQYQGYEFNYSGPHPVYTSYFGQWHVTVDTSNDFRITDRFEWGENGPVSYTTIDINNTPGDPADDVAAAAPLPLNDGQYLWLWSDALGGNITYLHDTAVTIPAQRKVTLYTQDFVLPNNPLFTGVVNLYCYERCLKGGLTQTQVNAMGSNESQLYHPNPMPDSTTGSVTPYTYTARLENGNLVVKDHTTALVSFAGLNLTAVGHDWGVNTGEMVKTRLADETQPWLVYEATDSYRWESGSKNWNQLVTVTKNSDGSYAAFDKPLEFNYEHKTANDANGDATFNLKKFRLQYGGLGELWGFPWVDDADGRWHASVTLADNTGLTDGVNTFVTKGMEKEQSMRAANPLNPADLSACSTLNVAGLADTLPLPTASEIGTVSFSLTDKPLVTAAPAVIEGELQ